MSILDDIKKNKVVHRIRVKLYRNHLQKAGGMYIAKVRNERTLTIEDICASMKAKGIYNGNVRELAATIHAFFDESAYLLCDGFAVNFGYYSVHASVGGSFRSPREARDQKKHPVGFRFSAGKKLRELTETIEVYVEGIADTNGHIDTFTDVEKDSVNKTFTPGNMFVIRGRKIKVEGDDPGIGLYFVPADAPSKAVKVTRIAVNSPSKITGVAPDTGYARNRVEIRTQYSGAANKFLKKVRTMASGFTLEAS